MKQFFYSEQEIDGETEREANKKKKIWKIELKAYREKSGEIILVGKRLNL